MGCVELNVYYMWLSADTFECYPFICGLFFFKSVPRLIIIHATDFEYCLLDPLARDQASLRNPQHKACWLYIDYEIADHCICVPSYSITRCIYQIYLRL